MRGLPLGLWVRLARRFMRTGPMRRSAAVVLVVAAMVLLFFVTQQGFNLSGAQIVQRDLGTRSSRMDLSSQIHVAPGQTRRLDGLLKALRRSGARRPIVLLGALEEVYPAVEHSPFTIYLEGPWASAPFPDRYHLLSGRWPNAAGEVVVSKAVTDAAGTGPTLSVLAGNATLRVVGRVRDRFATGDAQILAAPGTWDTLAIRGRGEKVLTPMAVPVLLWSGGDATRVTRALAAPIAARRDRGVAPAAPTQLRTDYVRTRGGELAEARQSQAVGLPLAYRFPSLLLPVLAVLAAFGLNGRRLRRNLAILRAVGISARDASVAVLLASAAWSLAAACAGATIGVLLGIAARPLAQTLVSAPLGPVPDVAGAIARLVGLVVITCAAIILAGVVVQRRPVAQAPRSAARRPRVIGHLRHALATLVAAAAVWRTMGLNGDDGNPVEQTMVLIGVLTALAALMTPELVGFATRRVPTSGPRGRLAGRQLQFDPRRALIAVALLTACLGPALGMATLNDTLIVTDAEARLSDAAPGQVNMRRPDGVPGAPPADLVRRIVDHVRPNAPPIQVDVLGNDKRTVDLDGDAFGQILSVATVRDAARLSNNRLTAAQRTTLRHGGLLVFGGHGHNRRRLELGDIDTEDIQRTTPSLKTTAGPFQLNWDAKADGLVLNTTADRLKLPRQHNDRVLTGVDAKTAAGLAQVALDAGYDASYAIVIHQDPQPDEPPAAFTSAIIGLGLLALLTVFAVARAQSSALRGYLAGLVAIGLPRRWAKDVLGLQTALLVGLSATLALLIAVPPIVAYGLLVPEVTISIPWLTITATIGCFLVVAALTTLLSSRDLHASDRSAADARTT